MTEYLLLRISESAASWQYLLQADTTQDSRVRGTTDRKMPTQGRGQIEVSTHPSSQLIRRRSIHQLMLELHCLNAKLGTFLAELEQHLQVGIAPSGGESTDEAEHRSRIRRD
jgi:hypothetical protein